jgi:DNA-binding transcriptional ArsR family regulator
MAADPTADRQALAGVITAGLVWHSICATTRLDVLDRLAAGPLSVAELAAAVGAHEDLLRRVLRLLADHQIVTMDQDRVGLTDRGRLLCRDHPRSMHAVFAAVGAEDVAHALTDTLRTGQPAAPRVLGAPYRPTGSTWSRILTSRPCSTRPWSSAPSRCRSPACR